MAERPIIFDGESVRAILAGRKTQTRRVVKPMPPTAFQPVLAVEEDPPLSGNVVGAVTWCLRDQTKFDMPKSEADWLQLHCPYGVPGDRLWVRETWWTTQTSETFHLRTESMYADPAYPKVSGVPFGREIPEEHHAAISRMRGVREVGRHRRNPLFLPRWAAHLTLEVVSVRVERVQEITHGDALAEGVAYDVSKPDGSPLARFRARWDAINAKRGHPWESNPWVWVVEFKRV